MNLTSPKQASELLRKHGLSPQKRLGQNFLCDRNTLDKIVGAAHLSSHERVLEIGGGLGALTLALAESSEAVTVVEIDRHLEPILREVTASFPSVHLVFADFLRVDLNALLDDAFGDTPGVVVANIPYYITTPILERLIEVKRRVRRIVVLVQLEFAKRAVAAPGSDECGSMSLFLQYHFRVQIAGVVPRTVFLPQPEVDSAILTLDSAVPGTVAVADEARMFRTIRAAFGPRRKTLLNALMRAPASFDLGLTKDDRERAEAWLQRAGIDGTRRGETLSLEEYARLADNFE